MTTRYIYPYLEGLGVWSFLAALAISAALGLVTIVYRTYYCSTLLKELECQDLTSAKDERRPESVNYHFTRQCNYECGFCFHTAKTSFVLPLEEAKHGLRMLKDAGS